MGVASAEAPTSSITGRDFLNEGIMIKECGYRKYRDESEEEQRPGWS